MKYLTRKNILIVSVVLIIYSLFSVGELGFCRDILNNCYLSVNNISESIMLFILAALFPFALVLQKPTVFEAWKRFAVWTVPVTVLLIAYILWKDSHAGGGFFGISFAPLYVGFIYFVYFVGSLVVIIKSWWKSRN